MFPDGSCAPLSRLVVRSPKSTSHTPSLQKRMVSSCHQDPSRTYTYKTARQTSSCRDPEKQVLAWVPPGFFYEAMGLVGQGWSLSVGWQWREIILWGGGRGVGQEDYHSA